MKKHIEYLEIQEKSNNAKLSAYKVVHVQLDYYPTGNILTFKLLAQMSSFPKTRHFPTLFCAHRMRVLK